MGPPACRVGGRSVTGSIDREAGFRLVDDSEESVVLEGVRSGLMSLVTGGLVLMTVAVAVVVDGDELDSVDENAGPM